MPLPGSRRIARAGSLYTGTFFSYKAFFRPRLFVRSILEVQLYFT